MSIESNNEFQNLDQSDSVGVAPEIDDFSNGPAIPDTLADAFANDNQEFGGGLPGLDESDEPINIEGLMDIRLDLIVEVGRAKMSLKEILEFQRGSVVELNRVAGGAVDVFVNDRLLAKGDIVVVDDRYGVRITEIIDAAKIKREI